MFGSKEEPYPRCVLIDFGVIMIIKTILFFYFLADISVLLILAIIKIW